MKASSLEERQRSTEQLVKATIGLHSSLIVEFKCLHLLSTL